MLSAVCVVAIGILAGLAVAASAAQSVGGFRAKNTTWRTRAAAAPGAGEPWWWVGGGVQPVLLTGLVLVAGGTLTWACAARHSMAALLTGLALTGLGLLAVVAAELTRHRLTEPAP